MLKRKVVGLVSSFVAPQRSCPNIYRSARLLDHTLFVCAA